MSNVAIYDEEDPVVANRVTAYLVSVNTPDYEERSDVLINPELPTGVAQKYWKVNEGSIVEMNSSEKNSIDLPGAKLDKIAAVQAKTAYNESIGVPYNNYRFSVTPAAKSNWLAVVISKDSLSYPFSAPTGFNSIYSFQDANDVVGFFGSSMAYLKYWEESDENLVIAINACTTVAEVEAITDDRSFPS